MSWRFSMEAQWLRRYFLGLHLVCAWMSLHLSLRLLNGLDKWVEEVAFYSEHWVFLLLFPALRFVRTVGWWTAAESRVGMKVRLLLYSALYE